MTGVSGAGVETRAEARLLVVDDEPNIRELLATSLRFAGLEVSGRPARQRPAAAAGPGTGLSHTPDGSPVEVGVAVAGGASEVRLTVRDEGRGLSAEDASRVFERFYRADDSRSRTAGGSGLGLSIVTALVEAHGGQAGVDTAPGHGATFWVRLPLDRSRQGQPGDSQPAHRSVTGN